MPLHLRRSLSRSIDVKIENNLNEFDMNYSRIYQAFVALAMFVLVTSCDKKPVQELPAPVLPDKETPVSPDNEVKYPDPKTPKVKTLLVDGYFKEQKIRDGIILYSAEKKPDAVTNENQTIFVLEIDLNNENYKVDFYYGSSDTTSAIAKKQGAIAAVNACYELEAIYCKTNGVIHGQCALATDHLRFWKHEAAIVSDGARKIGIIHGAKGTDNHKDGGIQALQIYSKLKEKNIFASAPMLIDDFNPVGATYVPSHYSSADLAKLDGEDWRRHQGVRHPRVAAALTEDNDLLLVVVDGRFSGKAAGMSAKELTNFLVKYFNPRWAINMDGGGSSTMYVKGYGDPVNNVLNYPADNKKWDHYGQRKRPSLFLIKEAK